MLEKGPQVPSLLIYPLYKEKEKKKRADSKKFKFFTWENFLYLISERYLGTLIPKSWYLLVSFHV